MKGVLLTGLLLLTSCQQQLVGLFRKGEYSQKEGIVEVPFTIENGLIIVPTEINGETYRFLLDTGAPNVVSTELAEKLNFKKRRDIRTNDSQGNSSMLSYVKLGKVSIQGADFTNTTAAVANLKQADAIACLNIDGLIGANLMRKAYWQIDYSKNILHIISHKENLSVPDNSYSIPFTAEATGTPIIHLKIGQTDIKRLKMDTGSVGFLSTDKDHYKDLKAKGEILAENTAYGTNSVGLFGASEKDTVRQVLVKTLSMGNLDLDQQIIDLRQSKLSLLGNSFFKNFLVTIDWKSNILYLSPQGKFCNSFAESFGISLMKEGEKMVVTMITEGSPAQQAGIRIGDIVLRVNDVDVAHTTLDEYCKVIKLVRVKEVETLRLVLDKDGGKNEYFLTKMPVLSK